MNENHQHGEVPFSLFTAYRIADKRREVGERAGREIAFLSVSLDAVAGNRPSSTTLVDLGYALVHFQENNYRRRNRQ